MDFGVYARRHRLTLTFVANFLITGTAAGFEVLDASVDKENGVYQVFGDSVIDAPVDFVYSVLIDYDNFHKISNGIAETRFVDSDVPGELLAYTRIEACVMFFCRSAERLERISSTVNVEIQAEAIPEDSDFVVYVSRWRLVRRGNSTRVTYEAEFKPDFWMPPLISTWAIKRKLVSSAENLGLRIEYLSDNGLTLAQIKAPPPAE